MGRDLTARVQGQADQQANGGQPTLQQMVERMRPEIARALPAHLNADRMVRLALTVLRKTPQLANTSPESFMGALMSASQLGLEPGVGDECYLVPYKRETTLIIGYQGYAKLFWQSPLAKHLDAQAVYANDEFDYAYGLEPFLRHKPSMDGPDGDPIAYYAVATLTSGGSAFVVLSPAQVKKLRGNTRPSQIADPMRWMERKTAIRQLVKMLPKSPNLIRALEVDEKVRTDTRLDAIDAPMQAPAIEAAPQTPAGVDATTGVIDGEIDPDADYASPPPEFWEQQEAASRG